MFENSPIIKDHYVNNLVVITQIIKSVILYVN